jgi:hypothetical protein
VLSGPLVSGCRHAARSPLSLLHPFAAHRALLPPGPAGQSATPALLAPCRPPLFAVHPLCLRGMHRPPLSERPRAAASVPCQSTLPNPVPPLCPVCSSTRRRSRDPDSSPTSASKGAGRHATLSSLPPSLSSAHDHVSPPLIHAGDRATVVLIIFPTAVVIVPPSPTVRPAYPSPLPYLGPPSPLSSSPASLGASRSHRRPSLR